MSILVTGGCGLIGSMLTRMLVEKGEEVSVLDNCLRPERFSGIADRVRVFEADLGNFAKMLNTPSP